MDNTTKTEIAALRAELAALREIVESLPVVQAKIAEKKMIAKETRLRAVGNMEPPEALAALAKMPDGDVARSLDMIGPESAAKILAGTDRKTAERYLSLASRALRDQVRAALVPDADVPRHVIIEPQSKLGRFGEPLEIPKKIATQLVGARVGSIDTDGRYYTPAMGVRARWPVHIYETLRGVWPLIDEGIATDSIRVRHCSLDEDRALLAAG